MSAARVRPALRSCQRLPGRLLPQAVLRPGGRFRRRLPARQRARSALSGERRLAAAGGGADCLDRRHRTGAGARRRSFARRLSHFPRGAAPARTVPRHHPARRADSGRLPRQRAAAREAHRPDRPRDAGCTQGTAGASGHRSKPRSSISAASGCSATSTPTACGTTSLRHSLVGRGVELVFDPGRIPIYRAIPHDLGSAAPRDAGGFIGGANPPCWRAPAAATRAACTPLIDGGHLFPFERPLHAAVAIRAMAATLSGI